MEFSQTERGFNLYTFLDVNGSVCSIQQSSQGGIWLGVNEADPKILEKKIIPGGTGWVKYPVHPDVSFTTRMHLDREKASALIGHLQRFVATGDI